MNSPAHVNGEGSEFRILNTADVRALVTLPEGAARVFEPTLVGARQVGRIPLLKGAWGAYTYSVVMVTPVDLVTAQGNSDPVIIIDPPAA